MKKMYVVVAIVNVALLVLAFMVGYRLGYYRAISQLLGNVHRELHDAHVNAIEILADSFEGGVGAHASPCGDRGEEACLFRPGRAGDPEGSD
jgi:hypothetical protein